MQKLCTLASSACKQCAYYWNATANEPRAKANFVSSAAKLEAA